MLISLRWLNELLEGEAASPLEPNVVADAAESHDPSILTSFLYELTRDYSRYNHDHHVLNAEEPIRSSRLALLVGLKTVLANGLRLLAIEPLEEM